MVWSKEERAAQEEVRPHIEKYLRAMGLSDDAFLLHFYVIGVGVSKSDADMERVISTPSQGFTFTHQMGVLDYVMTNQRYCVTHHDCEED